MALEDYFATVKFYYARMSFDILFQIINAAKMLLCDSGK